MFAIILMPFSAAFMAEYLCTLFAQPGIVIYCLNALLHNIGWNLLHRSIIKPVPLLKDSTAMKLHKKARRGAKYGFLIYAAIALLA